MKKLKKIFRTADVSEIDKYTIEHEPVSSLLLMERASQILVENLLEKNGYDKKYAVVTGWGNNGGDGYAVARLLKEQDQKVMVFRVMTDAAMSADCEVNYKRWDGELKELCMPDELVPDRDIIIIDAIFGSGLNRKVTGLVADVIRRINSLPNKVVSIDVPSGLMGEDNTGNDMSAVIRADFTYTFQFPKLSFMLPQNAPYVGEWIVLDIGLHRDIIEAKVTSWYYLTESVVAGMLPEQCKFAHKGINGHGLLVAGSYGMMGAAVLASKAAIRSGIGLLSCHVPAGERNVIHIAVPEVLVNPDESRTLFSGVKELEKYDAVAVGPGINRNPGTVTGLRKLLMEWKGVTVLDADALNIIADHPDMLELLHENCILTPHMKEFERLAGKSENDFDRLNKLSIFANRYQIYVVLKGAYTAIAFPSGEICFNMSGNPGMAKGGAGDVLTGVLLALAANRIKLPEAVLIGVYAHGLSGDLMREEKGMRGLCAGDIAEGMGKAWKRLESFRAK